MPENACKWCGMEMAADAEGCPWCHRVAPPPGFNAWAEAQGERASPQAFRRVARHDWATVAVIALLLLHGVLMYLDVNPIGLVITAVMICGVFDLTRWGLWFVTITRGLAIAAWPFGSCLGGG